MPYCFELGGCRGRMKGTAVFGALPNGATGTTQAAGDPPPPPSQPGTNPNEPAGFPRFAENDFTVPLLDYTAATGLLGLWRGPGPRRGRPRRHSGRVRGGWKGAPAPPVA